MFLIKQLFNLIRMCVLNWTKSDYLFMSHVSIFALWCCFSLMTDLHLAFDEAGDNCCILPSWRAPSCGWKQHIGAGFSMHGFGRFVRLGCRNEDSSSSGNVWMTAKAILRKAIMSYAMGRLQIGSNLFEKYVYIPLWTCLSVALKALEMAELDEKTNRC